MSYELAEPFAIDEEDGPGLSLTGLSPQAAFVLGVEWCMVRADILRGAPAEMPVHTANVVRLVMLAERHGVRATYRLHSSEWAFIQLGGAS